MVATQEPNAAFEQLIAQLRAIPSGSVISYGALAARCGRPRGARWAARCLSQLPEGHGLPWHRVLKADGKIAFPVDSDGFNKQCQRLHAEGVEVHNGRVRMQQPATLDLDQLLFGDGRESN